ncbi:M20/M25/M40 family metallo-hydrolase [Flavobacterium sp. MFBS3-15]|uniref:M20/M25/M40 family metallo-hydrolase n=1 Tax=Flavobacterium sp. MFBS3-15 TaxID=2989816 RepID=UPI002235A8C8|nr:M20/M25/M40 family metallo-hydrolase [Flavobacterium sp. MFBS3-15]MCW4470698.1 M20/M25/M40 family metallo-hydrolase [Flavobacterium sp. MFBS3-15]
MPHRGLASHLKVSEQSVYEAVAYLSSDGLQGRKPGTQGIELAAQYLEGVFSDNGILPYFESYRDGFLHNGSPTYNIVGHIEGCDEVLKHEYVVIGAHYDHEGVVVGGGPEQDVVYNGANDNASGVTAVIEIARYFAARRDNKRSLLFCFFTAEEDGRKGSGHLTQRLKAANFPIYAMVNFEMIGVPLEDGTVYLTGFERSNMGACFNSYAGKVFFKALAAVPNLVLYWNSDNYPFNDVFGVPAHSVTTFNMENYGQVHTIDDEIGNLDIQHITGVINEMLPVIAAMASTQLKEITTT